MGTQFYEGGIMGAILATCAVLIAIGGGLVAIPKIYKAWVAVSTFTVNFNKSAPILMTIANEFSRNGGHSLKDRVCGIDENLAKLSAKFVEHVIADDSQFKQVIAGMESQNETLARQNEVMDDIRSKVTDNTSLRLKT